MSWRSSFRVARARLFGARRLWALFAFASWVDPAATTALPAPIQRVVHACPLPAEGHVLGRVESRVLDELSGLVASRSQRGVFWTHNDSGDYPRVFAIDARGKRRGTLHVLDAFASDWEDIALIANPGGPDTLVLADIGDNLSRRTGVQLYFVDEPRLSPELPEQTLRSVARRLDVRYEDGPHDAEALLADPLTGDLYIVQKGPVALFWARVGVYRIPANKLHDEQVVAFRVAEIPLGPVTSGDVRHDGLGVALRNYTTARYYARSPHEPLFRAFQASGCELALADVGKLGEALCFAPDDASYFTVAEGRRPTLYRHDFRVP